MRRRPGELDQGRAEALHLDESGLQVEPALRWRADMFSCAACSRINMPWIRLFILTALAGACASGNATRVAVPQHPGDPTVDLELANAELTTRSSKLAGNARINLFADSHVNDAGRVTLRVHAARWEDVLAKIATEHQLRVEKLEVRGVDRPSFWISKRSSPPAPVTSFRGERITARFDDAPIREVAAALSNVAKTQIVVDNDVQATITLHMRLPWDLALYHLAQKYDLRIVRGDAEIPDQPSVAGTGSRSAQFVPASTPTTSGTSSSNACASPRAQTRAASRSSASGTSNRTSSTTWSERHAPRGPRARSARSASRSARRETSATEPSCVARRARRSAYERSCESSDSRPPIGQRRPAIVVDVAALAREAELLVLERAHLRVVAIEARDVLLRLGGGHAELERERARALAGERREVDDLAELPLVERDRLGRLLEDGGGGEPVHVGALRAAARRAPDPSSGARARRGRAG